MFADWWVISNRRMVYKKIPNGKNASLAKAAPLASSPAFLKANLKLSTRFGCPLPIPNIQLFFINNKSRIRNTNEERHIRKRDRDQTFAITMALLLTCLTQSQANLASASSLSVGVLSETDLKLMSSGVMSSESWANHPPPTCLSDSFPWSFFLASRILKVLDFPLSTSRPLAVYFGATTIS